MEKEIHDQPHAVADTLLGRTDADGRLVLDEMRISEEQLRAVDRITIVACGTAAYAGMVAKYAIEHWTPHPRRGRARARVPLLRPHRQRAHARRLDQPVRRDDGHPDGRQARRASSAPLTLSICNTHGSTIPRESDAVLYTHAGPEIAVASTKAFLAQITACYVLGLYLAQLRGGSFADDAQSVMKELARRSRPRSRRCSAGWTGSRRSPRFMADTRSVLFLGRHVGYPVAMEGALKLKELAYIHAEGFAAGELKHGPIALIEPGQPVFVVVPSPTSEHGLHGKVVSQHPGDPRPRRPHPRHRRGGRRGVEPFADEVIRVPATSPLLAPLLTVVPLQVFAL